jgi:hypothetical protein
MRPLNRLAVPLAVFAVAAGILTGCAQQPAQPGSPSSHTTASTPPGSSDCPAQLNVAATDSGKTLCVTLGGTVAIDLGPQATTTGQFDVAGTSLKPTGADGTYTAVSKGTTVITTERRNCPKPSPGSGMVACDSIELWKVTITVK